MLIETLINAIDLSMVKLKLQDKQDGPGWDTKLVNSIEIEYKRFLYLAHMTGDAVPTKEVDTMWHQHILDTRAYARDCFNVFGYFMHHFPYLGMRGEDDKKLLQSKFAITQEAYQATFKTSCKNCSPGHCSPAGCIGSCGNN